jgi:urease accessory protein
LTTVAAGTAHLKLSRSGPRTVLERSFATSPVKLFTTRNEGGACWVYSATLGGGFVGGDTVRMTLDVGEDAVALLSTQASTKIYRSPTPASQLISATVRDGALLAVVPDPVVCFSGADFSQRQRYDLTAGANLVVVDWMTSGRHATGERWAFTRYASRIHVARDHKLVFLDGLTLEHETDTVGQRMGRFNVCLTCVISGPRVAAEAESIVTAISQTAVRSGADPIESAYPIAGGAILRMAGTNLEEVSALIRTRLKFLHSLLGDDPWTRKW